MRLEPINLDIPVGVVTVDTDRGARGRWKNCDHIRFHEGLPQKLGGWILASVGTENGFATPITTFSALVGGAGYVATAASIPIAAPGLFAGILTGDRVWLFGNDFAGSGVRTALIDADLNPTYADLDGNVTMTAGDAVRIEYPEEYVLQALSAGTEIVDGFETGSTMITVADPIENYLRAGTVVRIALLAGGFHISKFLNNISFGATQFELETPLPSTASVAANSTKIFAAGSNYVGLEVPGATSSLVVRILANSPVASDDLIFTEPVLEDAAGYIVFLTPFQETFSTAGFSVGATSVTIAPVAAFGAAAGEFLMFPDLEINPVRYLGAVRAAHDWVDLDDERWAAIGTEVKLYLINEGALFDITPLAGTGVLVDPFDTTALSDVVNVSHSGHGRQTGDYVRFSGGTPVGGVDLDGEFKIFEVIDADNYTIIGPHAATATVNGGGNVSYEYDLSAGLAENSEIFGWGTGAYGVGPYGIGDAGLGIQAQMRIWSLDNFGEDLLASPTGGALYWWDKTLGPASRAVVRPNAPATMQRMLVSPQARHVIAFGAGDGSFSSPGDPDKLFTRWSDQADFDTWIPTSTNLAGDIRLDKGSEIITAVESRQDMITFTDVSLHALQYVGGSLVFGLRHLGQISALCGANAAVDANGIVWAMTESDFITYDGVIRVVDCPVLNTVYDVLDLNQTDKVFASVMNLFTEIWFFYNDTDYVKINWDEDAAWDFGSTPRTAFHDSSPFLKRPYGFMNGLIFQHETGVDNTTVEGTQSPLVSFIESGDSELDEAGSRLMFVGAMIPDFEILTGSIELTLSGRAYPQSPLKSNGPHVITNSTGRKAVRFRSRQVSFRVESNQLGDFWRMGGWRAEVRPAGKRGG
jgi:hypothetical protein